MRPTAPATGESLQISGIDQLDRRPADPAALKQLAKAKAPPTIAQMVFWYVTAGADWNDVGRLSQGGAMPASSRLAKQFVANLGDGEASEEAGPADRTYVDPGTLFWDIKAKAPGRQKLVDGLRDAWAKAPVLGLTASEGVPVIPGGPALACDAEVMDTGVDVRLQASHPSGSDWTLLDHFKLELPSSGTDSKAAALLGTPSRGP